jgi:hypothetical protein
MTAKYLLLSGHSELEIRQKKFTSIAGRTTHGPLGITAWLMTIFGNNIYFLKNYPP